jgi:hypothetical protein
MAGVACLHSIPFEVGMNYRRIASLLAFLPLAASAQGRSPNAPMRVLFVGNSYTYVNDLPMVIADLAAAAREARPFSPEVVLVGGQTLEGHIAGHDALPAIARGGWDAIVIQEQSTRPITDPGKMWRAVKTLADAAKKVNAKLVLYETWAREMAPATQDSLSHVYRKAASDVGATIAPVGEAWSAFRAGEGNVPAGTHSVLFRDDGSHPSPVGTYVAATVLYETLYGKSPVGLPAITRNTFAEPPVGPAPDAPRDTVPAALARKIQQLASKAKY